MLKDAIEAILALQPAYSAASTPAMQRRGRLIRRVLPQALLAHHAALAAALGPYGEDLRIEGRDGLGSKSATPWVRFFSRARSPKARDGWYCVYLFAAAGDGLYLSLAHGSTTWGPGGFRPRPPEEMAGLRDWGRRALGPVDEPRRAPALVLGGSALGASYEQASILALRYAAGAIPEDEALLEDARRFAGYLRRIHMAEDAAASAQPRRHLGGQGA
ncbi:MrcB family domain-containing protein [Pseudoroseomonas ludipueritiae]|uniref:DUF3578 domain-containing protein n=1 Tax=Pseudoroseomonas ludipueritiae TaxID=198093 RepID=A0ABR7RAL7_9PROT|nr:DUF3578 domain-containing protein [Pseudoroseomonas ludipueritiae]MBC9178617.1 DUF3578 domain-containing protein [Pseudoroseomonas ludipueritiae]